MHSLLVLLNEYFWNKKIYDFPKEVESKIITPPLMGVIPPKQGRVIPRKSYFWWKNAPNTWKWFHPIKISGKWLTFHHTKRPLIVVQSSLTYIHYFDQPSQEFKQSTKNQVKAKPLSLELLQGEQTQAQSFKSPKSSKLMYKEIERKEKYVMIT